MDIKEEIYNFVSTPEAIVSHEFKKRNKSINVRFTTFGNMAACKAIYDIINLLDNNTKLKIIKMMQSKQVN